MRRATGNAPALPTDSLVWLLGTMALVIAPHTLHLPVWLTASILGCGALRLALALRGQPLPGRLPRFAAVAAATAALYMSYGTLLGLQAGVALLCLMAGLKVLELRGRRDALAVVFLGYFLVVTHFLFAQTMATAAYALAAAWALTTLLIASQLPSGRGRPGAHARLAAVMLAQALPVMVALFLLFPRIPGPLWGMPDDAYAGMTGLSNEMTPGAISELTLSDEVAFRAEFPDEPPAYRQRYWRGPVLGGYDGRRWRQLDPRAPLEAPAVASRGRVTAYTVTLEPHNARWLLALDLATDVDRPARFDAARQLRQGDPVRERIRYQARSSLEYRLGDTLPPRQRALYTHLPEDAHPRTRELARSWRARAADDAALVAYGLRHFRREPFHYTLQPPRLAGDTMDAFLFDTRAGFCEHFAGAFTVLMRAAGIPARVVTGYLGGRMNPAGDYMIVRQSDAHAWVEVWLDEHGWQRVDPTGYVAPERVERGLAGSVPADDPVPAGAFEAPGVLRDLALRWDALNAYWHRWVLAYGPRVQQAFMERLRLDSWERLAAALGLTVGGTLALVGAAMLVRNRPPAPDPVAREWQRFCRRLGRAGLPRRPEEGPRDFAARAAAHWPRSAPSIHAAAQAFEALRYGRTPATRERLRTLRRMMRRVRVR